MSAPPEVKTHKMKAQQISASPFQTILQNFQSNLYIQNLDVHLKTAASIS